jgi:hypothetical protein
MKYILLALLLLSSITIHCDPCVIYVSTLASENSVKSKNGATKVDEQVNTQSNPNKIENESQPQENHDSITKLIALTYLREDLQAEKDDILKHKRCRKSYAQNDVRLNVVKRDAQYFEITTVFSANTEDLNTQVLTPYIARSTIPVEQQFFKGQIIEKYKRCLSFDTAKLPTQKLDDFTKCRVSDTTRFAASGNENLPVSAKCIECSTFITQAQLKPLIKEVEAEIYGSNPLIRAIRKLRLRIQATKKDCE